MSLVSQQDTVLNKLRVSKEDGEVHVVYNGVTANNWLTPIGITEYKDNRIQKGVAPLAPACQSTLRKRAHSAGSILGRRHEYGLQKPGTPDLEGLTGHQIKEKGSAHKATNGSCEFVQGRSQYLKVEGTVVDDFPKGETLRSLLIRPVTTGACRVRFELPADLWVEDQSPSFGHLRPVTSVGEYHSTGHISPKTRFHRPDLQDSMALRALKIPIGEELNSLRQGETSDTRPLSSKKVSYLNDTTLSFYSLKEMQSSLNKALGNLTSEGANTKPKLSKSTSSAPNAEKTAQIRGTQIIPKNRFDIDRIDGEYPITRSKLKPLLYDNELNEQHNMGCPNQCNGCFRACLASNDYFEKNEEVQASRIKTKPKPKKRPARIIRREFPDLQYLMLAKKDMERKSQNIYLKKRDVDL